MKIAFIGQKGIPAKSGGIEKHVQELSLGLAGADFDIFVYSRPHYTGSRKTKHQKVNIVNLPSINTKHLDAISHTLAASIHACFKKYDIVHYHGVGPALLSWIPKIFSPGTKVIATFHCIDRQHQKWNRLARIALGLGERAACVFPDKTITVSKNLRKYCRYRFDRATSYIPNGVQIDSRPVSRSRAEKIMAKWELNKNGYFLTVSRLVKHKGIHTLIKAYQKLNPEQKLVIVGDSAKTDQYVNYLKKLAGNNPKIIFTGQQTGRTLKTLFENAYLFIQPSEAEGLSITLLEAISYGRPVLTSDIEENQEVVGKTPWKFKNKSVNNLAKKLKLALADQKNLKIQAQKAKRKISKEYNWPKIVEETASLYQETLTPEIKLKEKAAGWQS